MSATVEPTVQTAPSSTPPAIEKSTKSVEPKTVESTPKALPIAATVASTQPAIEKSTKSVEPKTVKSTPATPPIAAAVDGKTIYTQKCVSCHGMKAEKSALGKSQIIADFTEEQIKDALKGYQDGSYGKEMKGLMQGQVKSLNGEQIDALAQHITTL